MPLMDGQKIVVKDNIRRVMAGHDLVLAVTVEHSSFTTPEGNNALIYTWTKDGVPLGNDDGDLDWHGVAHPREYWSRPVITLSQMKAEDAGIYQCEIHNHFGSVTSDPTTVEVFDLINDPLVGKNIIQNGDFRQGDFGWNLIDGSMEQKEPYWWDSARRMGMTGTDGMSPRSKHIVDKENYPEPQPGERLMGRWVDVGDKKLVRFYQDVNLTPISQLIDRTIEGVTSVDMKLGAWLMSYRFHNRWSYGFSDKQDNQGPHWGRGMGLVHSWDGTYNTPNEDFFVHWHIQNQFYRDIIKLHFICYDERDDEIKRIKLESTPSSYVSSQMHWKHRRVEIPKGTRKLRALVELQRDGERQYDDYDTDVQAYKLIMSGMWGVNARIFVNTPTVFPDADFPRFNENYKRWSMQHPKYVHPAVPNWFYDTLGDINHWADRVGWPGVEGNGPGGNGSATNLPDYVGAGNLYSLWRGCPATGLYRTDHEDLGQINDYKCFNIFHTNPSNWDDGSDKKGYGTAKKDSVKKANGLYEQYKYIGIPCKAKTAALACHNIKKMNLDWLIESNLQQMDYLGQSFMNFRYGLPTFSEDIASLSNIMTANRRVLDQDNNSTSPVIIQKLRMEDIDEHIFRYHNGNNFMPAGPWEGLGNGCYEEDPAEPYNYQNNQPHYLYEPFKIVANVNGATTQQDYANFRDFIRLPRENGELAHFIDRLYRIYHDFLEVSSTTEYSYFTFLDDQRQDVTEYQDIVTAQFNPDDFALIKQNMVDNYRMDDIYDRLQRKSGIPSNHFDIQRENIKKWIKIRLVGHTINTFLYWVRSKMYKEWKETDATTYPFSASCRDDSWSKILTENAQSMVLYADRPDD